MAGDSEPAATYVSDFAGEIIGSLLSLAKEKWIKFIG